MGMVVVRMQSTPCVIQLGRQIIACASRCQPEGPCHEPSVCNPAVGPPSLLILVARPDFLLSLS